MCEGPIRLLIPRAESSRLLTTRPFHTTHPATPHLPALHYNRAHNRDGCSRYISIDARPDRGTTAAPVLPASAFSRQPFAVKIGGTEKPGQRRSTVPPRPE